MHALASLDISLSIYLAFPCLPTLTKASLSDDRQADWNAFPKHPLLQISTCRTSQNYHLVRQRVPPWETQLKPWRRFILRLWLRFNLNSQPCHQKPKSTLKGNLDLSPRRLDGGRESSNAWVERCKSWRQKLRAHTPTFKCQTQALLYQTDA